MFYHCLSKFSPMHVKMLTMQNLMLDILCSERKLANLNTWSLDKYLGCTLAAHNYMHVLINTNNIIMVKEKHIISRNTLNSTNNWLPMEMSKFILYSQTRIRYNMG